MMKTREELQQELRTANSLIKRLKRNMSYTAELLSRYAEVPYSVSAQKRKYKQELNKQ